MKRIFLILAVIVLLALGAVGFLMVTATETEEDRVTLSLETLKGAVETRDPALLGQYLHEEYGGWGGDRASALELFGRGIQSYSDARIDTRELKVAINPAGDEATVDFEWSYRATIESDVRSVSREQMDRLPAQMVPWEKARAIFRKNAAGRWQLLWIDTRVPRFGN